MSISPLTVLARSLMRGRLAALAVLALLAIAAVPATSHASATGYDYWRSSFGIPSGVLKHKITGSGYHVEQNTASFHSAGKVCDWSMKFTYGGGRYTVRGPVHRGCVRSGGWGYVVNQNAPGGSSCAELWVKNWRSRIATQCHYSYG